MQLHQGTNTSTFTTSSADTGDYRRYMVVYLDVTAVSGTSPTLNVVLEDSPNGQDWFPVPGAAFTQVTAVGKQRLVVEHSGDFIRAVGTIAGTTPSFTSKISASGVL